MNYPKRRKSKDNPYIIGFDKKKNKYTLSFKDSKNERCLILIDKELYQVFNEFELNDLKQLNEFDRHIEHLNIMQNDEILYKRTIKKETSIEENLEHKADIMLLKSSLEKISPIQRRRIIKYYFEELSELEIAYLENVSQQSIHTSLIRGKEKLKVILKNYMD